MQYRLLILGLCTILAGFTLWGGPISGVTIEAVSSEFNQFGWDLLAIHLVDGSGLSGDPAVHAQTNSPGGGSWQTFSTDGRGSVTFNLGNSYNLGRIHIWNLNLFSPYQGRGARDVDIYTSENGIDWTDEGPYLFEIATGLNGDPGFDIVVSDWGAARYVRFDIANNWGGTDNAGHVGLSEVQFFADEGTAIPEPGTVWLLLAGAAAMAASKQRRRV